MSITLEERSIFIGCLICQRYLIDFINVALAFDTSQYNVDSRALIFGTNLFELLSIL